MIDKVIHYFWFGGNPKDELVQKCITSWKKYCPDYEIIEWNESNFDINLFKYASQAYKEKKYGFVTDPARFYIIYNYLLLSSYLFSIFILNFFFLFLFILYK